MGKVVDILKSVGAIISDSHIVLTSGLHSSGYINKDALYPHTQETSEVTKIMAEMFKDQDIDVVVGPALGGIILSQWVAHHLSQIKGKEIFGVYTEKDSEENQILRRGYDKFVKGKKVLVVEDLTATGGSAKKVVDTVKTAGGEVIGVCVMVNRDPKNVNETSVGAPFKPADVFIVDSFEESECPYCKQGRPINTEVGHGKEYLVKKGQ